MPPHAKSHLRPTILCVDDEPIVLEMRIRILESQGYETAGADSGPTALKLFEGIQPDLVVLDYNMPGMNGYEIGIQMRQRRPGIPLILLSAYIGLPETVTSCFDAYVTKGEDVPMFLACVARLLKRAA